MFPDFADPPAAYRSMPLWVWNGEVTETRITEMLEQFAAQGLGGVFVHPRPGLITEYLSGRWFELWRHALRECKRLGLICNIYDQNSYPSGFAGGHVPARAPHVVAQYVHAVSHHQAPVRLMGELLVAYRLSPGDADPVRLPSEANLNEAIQDGPVLTLELRRAAGIRGTPGSRWWMKRIPTPPVSSSPSLTKPIANMSATSLAGAFSLSLATNRRRALTLKVTGRAPFYLCRAVCCASSVTNTATT